MTVALPVSIAPQDGESIEAWLEHLADARRLFFQKATYDVDLATFDRAFPGQKEVDRSSAIGQYAVIFKSHPTTARLKETEEAGLRPGEPLPAMGGRAPPRGLTAGSVRFGPPRWRPGGCRRAGGPRIWRARARPSSAGCRRGRGPLGRGVRDDALRRGEVAIPAGRGPIHIAALALRTGAHGRCGTCRFTFARMDWEKALRGFRMPLKLERSLSDRTLAAYLTDLAKLRAYAEEQVPPIAPNAFALDDLQAFISTIARGGAAATSQARLLSAVRMFHRYLRKEKSIADDPSALLSSPRLGRKLPVFLTLDEINACLLYTSDAADERSSVDLGGRRIIKKKNLHNF